MASSRIVARSSRAFLSLQRIQCRTFTISTLRNNEFEALNKRTNDTSDTYRKYQIERPLNPHLTNTTSTIANEMPSIGEDAPPPELITNADDKFAPKDSVPENTERMTGGTQSSKDQHVSGTNSELGVGEMEGAQFKVEPIRRTGEDTNTMQGAGSTMSTKNAQGMDAATQTKLPEKDERKRQPGEGEWAQTVGTFKPAYRPVPSRWKGSEILSLLRRHVNERKAGGVIEGTGKSQQEGKGLGMMPEIKNFDQ
ncbi:tpr repeat [Pyrenophora seminiperda CCB06]|uniref:Tpr repeat n=1 Tax=Pyrenophora seminiperda CCB06 TaxID=1302712 RepID=A0A3M7LWA3_9PLEO|nr:tpr repeat [Pyrenophora seminiperda CCB06]